MNLSGQLETYQRTDPKVKIWDLTIPLRLSGMICGKLSSFMDIVWLQGAP